MFTQRHTAHKVNIKDIVSNEYVQREGESDFITINDTQVSRVRMICTIVNKFTNDERKSGTIILDDGTEVISMRAWENEFHLIDNTAIGQLVEVVGRVRVYNDEVYLTPEIVKKVHPDWLVLRKLEQGKEPKQSEEKKEEKKEETPVLRVKDAKRSDSDVEESSVDSELKDGVFNLIKDKGSAGATMDDLVKIVGDKTTTKGILKELLEDDMIFEPRAGKYKVL